VVSKNNKSYNNKKGTLKKSKPSECRCKEGANATLLQIIKTALKDISSKLKRRS